MDQELQLTEDEKLAKDFMMKLILEGSTIECDTGEASEIKFERPSWYDDVKFKRGQKYFHDNKFGIMNSNLFGLLSVLAEPKGLNILISTGRSSTPATARKRYVSTVFHMLSWYENDLVPNSKSWKSLLMVRKMHLLASTQAKAKKIGMISQTEIAMTAFGFMAYALTRPHTLGIRYKNLREDRDAFVFFWAVICAMLGVKDEFNMCKHKLEVVEIICEISRRYIFLQILQLETPEFMQMARAFYEGQKEFLPILSFDAMMFLNRRTAGLPGYQYKVDMKMESLCKTIFTDNELNQIHSYFKAREGYEYIREFVLDNNIKLIDIRRNRNSNNNIETPTENVKSSSNVIEFESLTALHKLLGLDHPSELQVTVISPSIDWKQVCNNSQYKKLPLRDRIIVYLRCEAFEGNYKCLGHFINEQLTKFILNKMKKYNK
uniref:CSON008879 protein n=1 Tax=Culicoides sonorensis TaxID=179676 RepID=A0A336LZD5_CULSO